MDSVGSILKDDDHNSHNRQNPNIQYSANKNMLSFLHNINIRTLMLISTNQRIKKLKL